MLEENQKKRSYDSFVASADARASSAPRFSAFGGGDAHFVEEMIGETNQLFPENRGDCRCFATREQLAFFC